MCFQWNPSNTEHLKCREVPPFQGDIYMMLGLGQLFWLVMRLWCRWGSTVRLTVCCMNTGLGMGLTNIRMNTLSFCYELWLIFMEMHYTCKCPCNYIAHYLPPIVLLLNISWSIASWEFGWYVIHREVQDRQIWNFDSILQIFTY